jgi:peptide/nickel transport system ATP-binding protein
VQSLVTVRNLVKHFPRGSTLFGTRSVVHALDGVSFDVPKGTILGVVGESGCGKSTVARLLMQMMPADDGEIIFDGRLVGSPGFSRRKFYRNAQMVFQESYASLNPRMTAEDSVAYGLIVRGENRKNARQQACEFLSRVGLDVKRCARAYPHELSGGQRQRVNIARALVTRPKLVVLDEAVSALDKSIEAQVLDLLLKMKDEFDLTYIFISHDLHTVRLVSDNIIVMYLGKVVEMGKSEDIFGRPKHPYTSALLASIPSMDPSKRLEKAPLSGDPPNPLNPPTGCRFHPRCRYSAEVCRVDEPKLFSVSASHQVACVIHDPRHNINEASGLSDWEESAIAG